MKFAAAAITGLREHLPVRDRAVGEVDPERRLVRQVALARLRLAGAAAKSAMQPRRTTSSRFTVSKC